MREGWALGGVVGFSFGNEFKNASLLGSVEDSRVLGLLSEA